MVCRKCFYLSAEIAFQALVCRKSTLLSAEIAFQATACRKSTLLSAGSSLSSHGLQKIHFTFCRNRLSSHGLQKIHFTICRQPCITLHSPTSDRILSKTHAGFRGIRHCASVRFSHAAHPGTRASFFYRLSRHAARKHSLSARIGPSRRV